MDAAVHASQQGALVWNRFKLAAVFFGDGHTGFCDDADVPVSGA